MRECWVIVNDGSTDRTAEIVQGYANTIPGSEPVLIDGLALLFGYCWGALRRINRPVCSQLTQFYRHEQLEKPAAIILSGCKLKRVDNFHVATERE
jgi:glycosyltransferase involved in cell wall biosynthesis